MAFRYAKSVYWGVAPESLEQITFDIAYFAWSPRTQFDYQQQDVIVNKYAPQRKIEASANRAINSNTWESSSSTASLTNEMTSSHIC